VPLRIVSAVLTIVAMIGSGFILASPAEATFPGRNGSIAFVRAGDLYTATATGGSIKRITSVGDLSDPRWSPDGRKLAYKDSRGVVYVRTMSTGKVLTLGVGANAAPAWSPDGARIAWSSTNPDTSQSEQYPYVVMVAYAGGTGAAQMLTKIYDGSYPYYDTQTLSAWNRDGQRLLFKSCSAHSTAWGCSLREYDLSTETFGTRMVNVNCDFELDSTCGLNLSIGNYSPNGNQVLFWGKGTQLPGSTATASGSDRVYAVNRDGTGLKRVSTATSGYNTTWSPNGASVLFTTRSGGVPNVMRSGTTSTSAPSMLIRNAGQADWQPLP
jgi:Tol biopolymer transport system component